ncbi:hypothetical protein CCR75_002195 [Bremia lactucae]|uniref:Uncharacterized protein n=1 Tax=Bremia lactucae TaxID=4779 RepID=A0A976FRA3_BRELC|nr:hypothetical protein CCR75_002195 [Bremia lactucae]
MANRGGAWNVPTNQIYFNTTGINPEETAMILASLSKGFSSTGAIAVSRPSDSDEETMESSDPDDSISHGRQVSVTSGTGRVHRVQEIHFDGPKGSKLDFTDDAGFSHCFQNESNRVKSLVTKHISIEELRAHFDRPIIDVAKDFGICITLMKKICRRNGIKRWPHRQIRSLSKSIASMEAAMLSSHGSEREKYRDQISNLRLKRESVIADPNKELLMHSKPSPTTLMHCDSSNQSVGPSCHLPLTLLSPRTSQEFYAPPQFLQNSSSLKIEKPATGRTNMSTCNSSTSRLSKGGRWTSEEHAAFLEGIRLYGKDWRRVAQVVMTRSAVQTRTHAQKYLSKFAGRFPFDTDGMLKDHSLASTHSKNGIKCNKPNASTLSPTTSLSSSSTAMTPASDDCASNKSWNVEEDNCIPKPGESMAMILNSPSTGALVLPTIFDQEDAAAFPDFVQQDGYSNSVTL